MERAEYIAKRIKEQRKLNKMTQNDLAEKIGVSLITVKRWESLKNWRCPNVLMFAKLADILGVSETYLMGINDTPIRLNISATEATNDVNNAQNLTVDDKINIKSDVALPIDKEKIIYDFGDHHLQLPATAEGYSAFNQFVAMMAAKHKTID